MDDESSSSSDRIRELEARLVAHGIVLKTIARLRQGVDGRHATREVQALGQSLLEQRRPSSYDPTSLFVVAPLQDHERAVPAAGRVVALDEWLIVLPWVSLKLPASGSARLPAAACFGGTS